MVHTIRRAASMRKEKLEKERLEEEEKKKKDLEAQENQKLIDTMPVLIFLLFSLFFFILTIKSRTRIM